MGGLFAKFVKQPVQKFNIENRVFREISKEKPKAAPKHASYSNPTLSPDTEVVKDQEAPKLMENLKDLYVKSEDHELVRLDNENRPLPQMRNYFEPSQYGYHEPESVTEGLITVRLAQDMLVKYETTLDKSNVNELSKEYKLDPSITKQIVNHFKALALYSPTDQKKNLTNIPFEKPKTNFLIASRHSEPKSDDTVK